MKIFISWSGQSSKEIARLFYDWLPIVLQYVEPYMSLEEIEKGTRWSDSVARELGQSNFGILCLTPQNLNSNWIYFEAGALAKAIDVAKVAPLLFRLKPSDIQGPLSQFQLTNIYDHAEIRRLIVSINNSAGEKSLDSSRLEKAFQAFWEKISNGINSIEQNESDPIDPVRDLEHVSLVLEEVLTLTRQQSQVLASNEFSYNPSNKADLLLQSYLIREGNNNHKELFWRRLADKYIVPSSRLDEVIGRYVRLTIKGKGLSGLCPFHKEEKPSFSVVPEKGFYHCFGCGAHGNVIDFLMRIEGLSHEDATKRLIDLN